MITIHGNSAHFSEAENDPFGDVGMKGVLIVRLSAAERRLRNLGHAFRRLSTRQLANASRNVE
jgi:hypothetical protein